MRHIMCKRTWHPGGMAEPLACPQTCNFHKRLMLPKLVSYILFRSLVGNSVSPSYTHELSVASQECHYSFLCPGIVGLLFTVVSDHCYTVVIIIIHSDRHIRLHSTCYTVTGSIGSWNECGVLCQLTDVMTRNLHVDKKATKQELLKAITKPFTKLIIQVCHMFLKCLISIVFLKQKQQPYLRVHIVFYTR